MTPGVDIDQSPSLAEKTVLSCFRSAAVVWDCLEEANPEFFEAYNMHLAFDDMVSYTKRVPPSEV